MNVVGFLLCLQYGSAIFFCAFLFVRCDICGGKVIWLLVMYFCALCRRINYS